MFCFYHTAVLLYRFHVGKHSMGGVPFQDHPVPSTQCKLFCEDIFQDVMPVLYVLGGNHLICCDHLLYCLVFNILSYFPLHTQNLSEESGIFEEFCEMLPKIFRTTSARVLSSRNRTSSYK